MIRPDAIFDSRDERFKSPAGAVRSGTCITMRMLISAELDPAYVQLVIHYDRHEQPAYYPMSASPSGSCANEDGAGIGYDGYVPYSCSLQIHDTGLYWYHFMIDTPGGMLLIGKNAADNQAVITDAPCKWQQTVYQRLYPEPEWIHGGVFYQIFVDRFYPSGRPRTEQPGKIIRDDWSGTPVWESVDGRVYNNDFFGGDLEGVRMKLPYLADLGVTCLYLNPIFEAYSNHKYDTADYESIDPMFGDEDDFRTLCRDAEALGIRIICDGVFAHTGSDSLYFDKYGHYGGHGAYSDPQSPYRSWYYFHEDGTYDSWWGFDTLPKLNKDDPSYVSYITGDDGIAARWLRSGASGWRIDVADELPNHFMHSLVAAAKAAREDALIIGEVWEDASNKTAYDQRKNYFEGDSLDSVMNYPFRCGIIDFVRSGSAFALAGIVEEIMENYPPEVINCLMNILGTHDSVRIITALAGADLGSDPSREQQAHTHMSDEEWERGVRALKIASLLQMTLPGVPCIYYGDEAGTEGYKDPFNRTCYPWGHEHQELLHWYKKIISLRRSRGIFRRGRYRTLACSDGLYAFERYSGADDADQFPAIIVAANCGDERQSLSLSGRWIDLLTGSTISGDQTLMPGEVVFAESVSI